MAFGISYDGLLQHDTISMKQSNLVKDQHEGRLLKVTANDTVGLTVDNDNFIGVCRTVEKGLCGVGLSGVVEIAYTGTAPSLGRARLISNNTGGVKVGADTDKEYLVVKVDTTASTVTFFL